MRILVSIPLALVVLAGVAAAQPSLKTILEQAAGPTAAPAAAAPAASPADDAPGPDDELQRGTPRSAVSGFLAAARASDYARAAEYLDLRRLPPSVAKEGGDRLARHLKTVLDRTLWIDLESLSSSPAGKSKDGLSSSRERLGRIETSDGKVELTLQRVPREPDGVSVWKISSDTVKKIPDLYRRFGDGLLGEYLPAFFFEYEFLTVALWQWIALAVLVPLSYLLAWLATWLALRLLARAWTAGGRRVSRRIAGPLQLALAATLFTAGSRFLGLSLVARGVLGALETTLLIVAFAWVVSRFLDGIGQVIAVRLRRGGNDSALPLVRPGVRTAKIVVAGLALLAMLAGFGLDVTAVVAGLGVGGIAVALAAQKSIENFFGGLSIFADEPVRVGDLCRFGGTLGVVEEIGLRSTRIRTPDRTLVTIPNAEFSQLQLENLTIRDKYRFATSLALRSDTSPEQLRRILGALRKLLEAHPKVDADSARARFVKVGAYSFDVEVTAYFATEGPDEFADIVEEVNFEIVDAVRSAGSDFALPSQTTYTEPGKGLHPTKVRALQEPEEARRESGARDGGGRSAS
jgi:MscS family membrane protein